MVKFKIILLEKLVKDSDKEQVRQNFELTLVAEYKYEKTDIGLDEKLKYTTEVNR